MPASKAGALPLQRPTLTAVRFGRALCGNLDAASEREWLVADGLGGFGMGTVAGLRTRRYHGLLIVAPRPPRGPVLGLAPVHPLLVIGERPDPPPPAARAARARHPHRPRPP